MAPKHNLIIQRTKSSNRLRCKMVCFMAFNLMKSCLMNFYFNRIIIHSHHTFSHDAGKQSELAWLVIFESKN